MNHAVVVAGEVALAAALDLDHVGAEVGKVACAERRSDRLLEANDAQAGERKG